jgi:hypothetical protein
MFCRLQTYIYRYATVPCFRPPGVRGGVAGATLVGLAFVIPSFLMVIALAVLYVRDPGLIYTRAPVTIWTQASRRTTPSC